MSDLATVHVGTSGWQYDHWRGDFYPRALPRSRWFSHYSAAFSTVELNNTFYRQPRTEIWQRWRDEAPAGFRYAVKANRFITHIRRFNNTAAAVERFLEGMERLGERLGPVLFQTPPDFEYNAVNSQRLEGFLECLPKRISRVVEFRHRTWYRDDALQILRRTSSALCIHDMAGLVTPVVLTGPVAYIRLHGSNGRYEGSHTDEELQRWADKIGALRSDCESVWCYFNNDIGGHAPHNALTILGMLSARTR